METEQTAAQWRPQYVNCTTNNLKNHFTFYKRLFVKIFGDSSMMMMMVVEMCVTPPGGHHKNFSPCGSL